MKTIYIDPLVKQPGIFQSILEEHLKTYRVILSIEECPPGNVEVAIIWLEVPGLIKQFPNLKLILVCGSGVDHIIDSTMIPRSIPIIRLVDPCLRERVANYVLKYVKLYFENYLKGFNHLTVTSEASSLVNNVNKNVGTWQPEVDRNCICR